MTDLIIYSHEEGMAKPDKRIYELTWTRLKIQPEEIVFLDNDEQYVVAARELGIHAIQFRDTAQAIAEVEACLLANR
jgi:HAD superfamily hydrolase (TIGR01509 family)